MVKISLATNSPEGENEVLWKALNDDQKRKIWKSANKITLEKSKSKRGRFYEFFAGGNEDPETAINAMALICALLIAIPYGVMGSLTPDFLANMNTLIDSCAPGTVKADTTYDDLYRMYLGNIAGATYACMLGLEMASIYYVLKPKSNDLKEFMQVKGKVLLVLIVLCTISGIVCCMNLLSNLFY